jgi:hypothetical protein
MAKAKSKAVITKLVLINLHISYDTGRRTMKALSKKVASDNQADANMITTSVKLIPNDKIGSFTTAISKARDYYKSKSLPWEDGNWRVVPVNRLQQFKDDLDALISEVKDEFRKCFENNYDTLKESAEKKRGAIKIEFPTKKELKESFNIEYNLGAIASSDDIRIVGIDTAMRDKIKKETESRYNAQIEKGLQELAQNLLSAVEDISNRVSEDDQTGKKYTRFMNNLKGMAETAENLNVTGNETLVDSCKMIRENIANWSPEAIKTQPEVRESIKKAAGGIRESLAKVSIAAEEDDD